MYSGVWQLALPQQLRFGYILIMGGPRLATARSHSIRIKVKLLRKLDATLHMDYTGNAAVHCSSINFIIDAIPSFQAQNNVNRGAGG